MGGVRQAVRVVGGEQRFESFVRERGLIPSLTHEDPRYFVKLFGSPKSRILYAMTRVLITRTDDGRSTFNWSNVMGGLMAEGLATSYLPDSERTYGENVHTIWRTNWIQRARQRGEGILADNFQELANQQADPARAVGSRHRDSAGWSASATSAEGPTALDAQNFAETSR